MIVELATSGISILIMSWAVAVVKELRRDIIDLQKVVGQLVNIAEGQEDYSDLDEDEEDQEDEE